MNFRAQARYGNATKTSLVVTIPKEIVKQMNIQQHEIMVLDIYREEKDQ